jgi:hypothetical protein
MGCDKVTLHPRDPEATGTAKQHREKATEQNPTHQHVEEQIRHQLGCRNAAEPFKPEREPVASKHERSQLGSGEHDQRRERWDGNLNTEDDGDWIETKELRKREREENLKAEEWAAPQHHPQANPHRNFSRAGVLSRQRFEQHSEATKESHGSL